MLGDWDRKARMSDSDGEGIESFLEEINHAINQLSNNPKCEEFQRRVCLATRAAYTEFYTMSVIESKFDSKTIKMLCDSIENAVRVLPEGKYRTSVSNRANELQKFVEAAMHSPTDTAV